MYSSTAYPIELAPKVLAWADPDTTEPEAVLQCARLARLDIVDPYIAVMPDVHVGKGACVGTVIPTAGALIPAAVGVDIGCGMMAVRTELRRDALEAGEGGLRGLREAIERDIPTVGRMPVYNREVRGTAEPKVAELEALAREKGIRPNDFDANWHLQLGSLGGGNHFIEVVTDESGAVWLFLHSGSRGVGNRMANVFIRKAVEYCKQAHIPLEDRDLAYLPDGEDEHQQYVACVEWAQRFAWLNRAEMMDGLAEQVARHAGLADAARRDLRRETIACHHNYTVAQSGSRWLTRKGAIDASEGVMGLIPGSMGTASYVVRGRGNAQALNSAPHGAGRRFSRTKAKATFTLEDLRAQTEGVEARIDPALIDELPAAYKDIDRVMELAAPLVERVHTFRQFLNVKGD